MIELGENVSVGPGATFLTSTHQVGGRDARAGSVVLAPIRVGSGAWIGARVVVLPGVTIGPGAVIAAGSVVTEDCVGHSLHAGVPARFKKFLS
ncbi:acyltransferase [Curtobacterium sp. SGAir0471]|uniref:acyltransferase n=1 Tax=Curtobacterium sp. SGAir0471 TaxID=2070337 RepID=UPI001586B6EA